MNGLELCYISLRWSASNYSAKKSQPWLCNLQHESLSVIWGFNDLDNLGTQFINDASVKESFVALSFNLWCFSFCTIFPEISSNRLEKTFPKVKLWPLSNKSSGQMNVLMMKDCLHYQIISNDLIQIWMHLEAAVWNHLFMKLLRLSAKALLIGKSIFIPADYHGSHDTVTWASFLVEMFFLQRTQHPINRSATEEIKKVNASSC